MLHTAQAASEQRSHTAAWYGALSQREQEILRLQQRRIESRDFGEAVSFRNTVKFHLKNVYLKLDVKNRAQAILKAQLDLR